MARYYQLILLNRLVFRKHPHQVLRFFLTAYDEYNIPHTIKSESNDYLLKPAHPHDIQKSLIKYIPVVKRTVSTSLEAVCEHDDILIVLEYIENNYHLDIKLDTLSRLVFLSG